MRGSKRVHAKYAEQLARIFAAHPVEHNLHERWMTCICVT